MYKNIQTVVTVYLDTEGTSFTALHSRTRLNLTWQGCVCLHQVKVQICFTAVTLQLNLHLKQLCGDTTCNLSLNLVLLVTGFLPREFLQLLHLVVNSIRSRGHNDSPEVEQYHFLLRHLWSLWKLSASVFLSLKPLTYAFLKKVSANFHAINRAARFKPRARVRCFEGVVSYANETHVT